MNPVNAPRLTLTYELDAPLSRRDGRELWLLRRRCDGAPFVAEIDRDPEALMEEFRLLSLAHEALPGRVPVPVDCFEEAGAGCLLRSYLPGKTLDQGWDRTGDEAACRALGIQACALLEALHSLTPPLIHRDIKPENLVLGEDGKLRLIDFGIARRYDRSKDTDTRFLGTETTAAPEQYGFSQTDCRTDLYALGRTLVWALTGSYDRKALDHAPVSRQLRKVLLRCTDFSPEKRYASAGELRAALAGKKPLWKAAVAAAACGAALCGLLLGPAVQSGRTVQFSSRCLEAAVRQELERPEGSITYGDLAEVERLALLGETAFSRERTYTCAGTSYLDREDFSNIPSGDVSDLSLLARMPNLSELYLCAQRVSDLGPLEGLPLRVLALTGNEIEDLTPLASLTGLEQLWIGDNPCRDLSPLASLTGLRELNLDSGYGTALVDSLTPGANLPLEVLSLVNVEAEDGNWTLLAGLPRLDELTLGSPPEEALAALARRERLLPVVNIYWLNQADLSPLAGCGVRDLRINGGLDSLNGVGGLPNLRNLGVFSADVDSLAPLREAVELETVSLASLPVEDFSPLNELSRLHTVVADRPEDVARDCPGRRFALPGYD